MNHRFIASLLALAVASTGVIIACSSDDSSPGGGTAASTTTVRVTAAGESEGEKENLAGSVGQAPLVLG